MVDLLKEMREYFENTPQEQIEADWKKCEQWDKVGITVIELFKNLEDESKIIKES